MRVLTIRPKDMYNVNTVYYPAGKPTEENPKTGYWMNYTDTEWSKYSICYTEKQIEDEVKQHGVFSPFIPFCMTPPPQMKPKV